MESKTFLGKPCKKCGNSERYLSKGHRCVACALAVSNKYKSENKTEIKSKNLIYLRNSKDKRKVYYEKNKEEIAEKNRIAYQKNREKKLVQKKEYFQKTKETRLAKMAEYRNANKQKLAELNKQWREKNKDVLSEKRKKYQKDNAELINARCMKRHCKKLQRIPKWADLDKIKDVYANCPKGMEVDHIIPLQGELVSGLHVAENLQYLTQKENCSKNNKFEPIFTIKTHV
jgi:hypothetical protein